VIAGDWPVANVEVLWPESPAPGIRAVVGELQVDIAIREPLEALPHRRELPEVGPVMCVAIEDLCAWKIHGLVEFGHGQWRPKDVYDLDVIAEIATRIPWDRALVHRAVVRAFTSRAHQVPFLDDFLDRDIWGESASGRKRWRAFARDFPAAGDFQPLRDRVRAFVRSLVR
jgi:hypothetical protein